MLIVASTSALTTMGHSLVSVKQTTPRHLIKQAALVRYKTIMLLANNRILVLNIYNFNSDLMLDWIHN